MTRAIVWTEDIVRSRCEPEGECWIWKQGTNGKGTPQANIAGRCTTVAAWVLRQKLGRELRPKHVASLKCGNPLCVSPHCVVERHRGEVLRLAWASGARSSASTLLVQRAEAVRRGMAKLDAEKAAQIRARRHEGSKALAEEFGVTRAAINDVLAGRRWAPVIAGASVFSWARAA